MDTPDNDTGNELNPDELPGSAESGRSEPLPSYTCTTADEPAGTVMVALRSPHDARCAGVMAAESASPDVSPGRSVSFPPAAVVDASDDSFDASAKLSENVLVAIGK